MRRTALKQSELIQSMAWKDGVLEIKYKSNGAVYRYKKVSESLYRALKRSAHPGEDWLAVRDQFDYVEAK
jgi:hypothetical protein